VQVSYINERADQEYLFRVDKGSLIGKFNLDHYLMTVEGDFKTTYLKSGNVILLRDRILKLAFEMDIDRRHKLFKIEKGAIYLQGMAFNLTGTINSKKKNKILNLNIGSKKSGLQSLMNLVPAEYLKPVYDYRINGQVNFNANIKGPFTGNKLPVVSFDFDLKNGQVEHLQSHRLFQDVSLKGSFTNGKMKSKKSFALHLKNINAELKAGKLTGEISITNFEQPEFFAVLKSQFQLENFKLPVQVQTVDGLSGNAEINISFRNKLKSFRKFTIDDFIGSQTSGTLKVADVGFSIKNSPLHFSEFTGSFEFSDKNLVVRSFSGKVSESEFEMKGNFINVMPYTFYNDENLRIVADFKSDNFNLTELLEYKTTASDTIYQLDFSDRISFDLNTQIKKFSFRKFNAENISGRINLNEQKLIVENATFDAMDGSTRISGQIDKVGPENFNISCEAEINNVNIHDLFYELGEFNQDNITSKHLMGDLTAEIYYTSSLTNHLVIDPDGVYVLADIEIHNGELINYAPMLKLSKFIKADELEHIRFSKLKNTIRIEDRVVNIPEMEIESSALNISLNGTHSFKNEIDYHAWIQLSELRSGRDRNQEEIEGIIIQDDGLGNPSIPVKMTGNANSPDISFDVKASRTKISSELKKEKENLKVALKKEFGGNDKVKKEDDIIFKQENNDSSDFIIDWEEMEQDTIEKIAIPEKKKSEIKPSNKKEEKDFIIDWDEEEEGDTIR